MVSSFRLNKGDFQMSSEKKYIHFNCPIELLKEFDRTIQGRYNSRTDAILDAMRKLIKELKHNG